MKPLGILALFLLLVTSACTTDAGIIHAVPEIETTPTYTLTPSPTYTLTPSPTYTLTPSPTSTPTPTSTPPASPLETPEAPNSPLATPTPPISPLPTPTSFVSPLETPAPPAEARPRPIPYLSPPHYRLLRQYALYMPTLTLARATPDAGSAHDAAPVATSPLPTPTYPPPPEAVDVPILMYHYVSPLPDDTDNLRRGLTVVPEMFEAQLQYLQENGYETITLRDLYDALSIGKPLPEKPIVLTFDDGYKDAYKHAWPLLAKYGYVGEFFVLATPSHYEAAHYMTWADMAEMAEAGMSLQGHGRDHYDLRNRDYDFLVYQILGIKEAVEAHTERPVTFFCYPAGKYDDDVIAVVESAGYLGAVTTEWGTRQTLENRYTWPRLRINGNWSLETFIDVIEATQ